MKVDPFQLQEKTGLKSNCELQNIESEAMIIKATYMQQLALVCAIALAMVGAATAQPQAQVQHPVALPGCNSTCGNIIIPYPFGTGNSSSNPHQNCFLDSSFELICNHSTITLGDFEVLNISLESHEVEISFPVSSACYDESGDPTIHPLEHYIEGYSYTVSSKKNKFYSVGCDTYGYFYSYQDDGEMYSTGCLTICDNGTDKENSGSCSGIGCCQAEIPLGMNYISIKAYSFNNYSDVSRNTFNRCSYAFVHKLNEHDIGYSLSADDINGGLQFKTTPMVIEWIVENETCEAARKSNSYACRNNSYCDYSEISNGYWCLCNSGYEGNPYLSEGCQDIDECDNSRQSSKHNCTKTQECKNTDGSFHCVCKKGYYNEVTDCQKIQPEDTLTKVVIFAGVGFIALLVGISTTYLVHQKRKLIKLKEKFFRQNGGFILEQELSIREDSSQSRAQIFTAEELKKATKNYDESLIIGKGGYGTVFKGFLTDNRIVAIKKSKVVDQSQIEQFINEVVVLSQINHRNVVKLLGCCLETEVPLLVYEFVNNGTLYDYIHNESKANNVSWKTRLRIAAEAAGALSYLHSAASIPIIHRDVKTANILLDETCTAKVSDFGASRLIPIDHAEIATMVQGTVGYLDPEYMLTSQLTEKSDVFSFGVVLLELLTGEKALSFDRPEEKRSLSMHFLSSFKEGSLFEVFEKGIVNEENKAEVMEVAVLASKCLRLTGDERPSMKEVAMELEGIRMMNKHRWGSSNIEINLDETEYLLHEKSGIYEHGDSSSHHNTGFDSIRDHVLIPFDDGR